MFCNSNCCCGANMMNSCGVTPIIAPRRVCTCCSNLLVEQPIICPVECRHVRNIVYVPRYYPRFERTFMTQSAGNPFMQAGGYNGEDNLNAGGFNPANDYGPAGSSNMDNMFNNNPMGNNCGCKNRC